MVPATEAKTSMALLSSLQRLDVALFDKVFRYGRERKKVSKGAVALSRSGDGYAQCLAPALVWSFESVLAPTYFVALGTAMIIERATYFVMKNTLKRLRPADFRSNIRSLVTASDKFSFPSGHTSAAFCFSVITVLVFGGLSGLMLAWAIVVGLSRVLVGVHFPGDIMAGALMGSSVALGTASFLSLW